MEMPKTSFKLKPDFELSEAFVQPTFQYFDDELSTNFAQNHSPQ